MQAYALARPTIRFRLRVLKAKNNNCDLVYAPKADANIEDAVLKVIGKDCALQCDWTALQADGFEVHAFLPKPGASGPKIAHQGAFVSVDSRPVSSSRGTIKQIVAAYKDRLRKSTPSLAGVKDPFFCMNIICPPDSYDPNIEPAKDDVMFDNSDIVLSVADKMLKAYYPEADLAVPDLHEAEIPTSAQQYNTQLEQSPERTDSSIMIHEYESDSRNKEPSTNPTQMLPHWRSSMYGIDEDDLDFLQENEPPVVEEEEGLRAPEVSNPWTIARMNTVIKPRPAVINEQLLSPAKSQRGRDLHLSSPSHAVAPHRLSSAAPLTPQTSPRTNVMRSPLDAELERSIQRMPQSSPEASTLDTGTQDRTTDIRHRDVFSASPLQTGMSNHFTQPDARPIGSRLIGSNQPGTSSQGILPLVSSAPRNRHTQRAYLNKPFALPTRESGAPSLSAAQLSRPSHHQHAMMNEGPRLPAKVLSTPRRAVLSTAERIVPNQLYSTNSDIRDFFGHSAQRPHPPSQLNTPADGLFRGSSAEQRFHLKRGREHLLVRDDRGMNAGLRNMAQEPRTFAERESLPLTSSTGSQMSMLFDQRPIGIRDTLSMHDEDGARFEPHNRTRQIQIHDRSFSPSPTPRPSDARGEWPLIPQRPSQVAATSDTHLPENSAREMEAYFKAQEQQHSSSPTRPAFSSQTQEPCITTPHETANKTSRPKRRTTDTHNLERTKSSKLALERTPKALQTQNLILLLPTSIRTIIQFSHNLDMRRNSPEWGYAYPDTHSSSFSSPVSETQITEWVVKLDTLLCKRYEKMDKRDTRWEIHDGIQRALDAREEVLVPDDTAQRVEGIGYDIVPGVVEVLEKHVFRDNASTASIVTPQLRVGSEGTTDDDEECGFDVQRFVDRTEEGETRSTGTADEGAVEEVNGEYEGDIEDEMLMDL